MEALLAGEEALYGSGREGGMQEEHVALQSVKQRGGGVMSSKALAKAREIVGDDDDEEEGEDDEELE